MSNVQTAVVDIMVPGSMSTKWAGLGDWEEHRNIIKELYLEQRRPLHDVVRIMQQEYRFFATPKMYKTRFKAWGFNKKYSAVESKLRSRPQTMEQVLPGNHFVLVDSGGWVSPVKVRHAFKTTHPQYVAGLTNSGVGGYVFFSANQAESWDASIFRTTQMNVSLPGRISTPGILKLPEECIRAVLDYTHSRFEMGAWSLTDDDADSTDVSMWSNKMVMAKETVEQGNLRAGFRMFHICFYKYKSLLEQGHSELLQKSLNVAFYLLEVRADLAQSFIRYVANLCSVVLGASHPLSRIWHVLSTVDHSEMKIYADAIIQAQCDALMIYLGSRNRFLACLNLEIARTFHRFKIITMEKAMDLVEKVEQEIYSDIDYWTMDYVLWAKCELASIFVQNGDFDDAEQTLRYIGDCLARDRTGITLWTKISYYAVCQKVAKNQGLRGEVTRLNEARLRVCLEDVGPEHPQTARAVRQLEEHYRDIGDTNSAEDLRLDFEHKWNRICEREAPDLRLPVETDLRIEEF